MKFILLLLLILVTTLCSAQGDWAPTGAVWHYTYSNQYVNGYVKIESIGDTLISGQSCKILEKTRIYNNHPSTTIDTFSLGKEYTYCDSNIVYYYRFGQFFVLYDFNATNNDSWIVSGSDPLPGNCDTVGYTIVDSTTIMNINTYDLKGLYINHPDSSNWSMYGLVLEKLGCLSYMFPEPYMCIIDAYEGGGLRCYSDSIFGFYQKDTTSCDYIYMANNIANVKSNSNVKIYPNPTNKNIFVDIYSTKTDKYIINIYSVLGIRIKEIMPEDKISLVDLSDLSNGCYYIEVVNSENNRIVRKIIKNAP